MRVCPTQAIRVRDAKARVNERLCIDCGECIVACPEDAFRAITDKPENLKDFPFKIAIPSPSLFGQFPMDVTPADIVEGLLSLGFDAVYGTAREAEIINLAIRDYLDESKGPYPLISSNCPVVVRLVQVAYPEMVDQIIPIEPPREVAGREAKRLYAEQTGLDPEQIAAVYLSPCTAKVTAIKQPAEGVRSYLDFGIGIADIYNALCSAITNLKKAQARGDAAKFDDPIKSKVCLGWETIGGQCTSLKPSRYISVAQLPNVIRIFDDIEKGKLERIEFLECSACAGGCVGGSLTVDDTFVSSSKIHKLIEVMEKAKTQAFMLEARRIYRKGDYFIRQPVRPRSLETEPLGFEERVERMKVRDRLVEFLPGLDCGLCGAPSCAAFAEDVSVGDAKPSDCILMSEDRVRRLRKAYRIGPSGPSCTNDSESG